MNKLEEYKLKKVTNNLGFGSVNPEFTPVEIQAYRETLKYYWKTGFDAAIALDLPVKFAEWCLYGKYEAFKNIRRHASMQGLSLEEETKELYRYWIENVYNLE